MTVSAVGLLKEELGRELRGLRIAAGLTQDTVARRAGYARGSITMVEKGRQNLSRDFVERLESVLQARGTLLAIYDRLEAARLAVRVPAAHGDAAALEDQSVNRRELLRQAAVISGAALLPTSWGDERWERPEVAAIRDALMRYDTVPALIEGEQETPSSSRLRQDVARSWADFQYSRYSALGAGLPGLLSLSRRAARGLDGDQRLEAAALLAESYQLAAIMLLKLGESHLAWVAADRGMFAAEQAQSQLVVGSSARILAYAYMGEGLHRQARDLTVGAASVLEPSVDSKSPAYLSVYGALMLKGAMAAAQQGDRSDALALLDEAETAADRLGSDANHCHTAFGPTNVLLHRASAAVELGDGGSAVDHARRVTPAQLPVIERRAQLLVDAARGFGQWGKDEQALSALLSAERFAPEEVRCQPNVRTLVSDLLRRERIREPQLRALATRVGAA